jgi:hypothetical protein
MAFYGVLRLALAIAVGPGSKNIFSAHCLHRQTLLILGHYAKLCMSISSDLNTNAFEHCPFIPFPTTHFSRLFDHSQVEHLHINGKVCNRRGKIRMMLPKFVSASQAVIIRNSRTYM